MKLAGWTDAATSQGVPPGAGRGKGKGHPRAFGRHMVVMASWFLDSWPPKLGENELLLFEATKSVVLRSSSCRKKCHKCLSYVAHCRSSISLACCHYCCSDGRMLNLSPNLSVFRPLLSLIIL